MNRYGQITHDQHRQHRPLEHSLVDDPTRFFTEIGDQIQADVTSLRDEILGSARPGESIEDYRHRSYQALATAEELVLSNHYLFQPEHQETDEIDDPLLDRYYQDLAATNHAIHSSA